MKKPAFKQAVLLAAGQGTRMNELTADKPKALVSLQGTSLISFVLSFFYRLGVRHVYLNTFYKNDVLEAWLNDFNRHHRLQTSWLTESELMGTSGGMAGLIDRWPQLDDGFILANCDVIPLVSGQAALELHRQAEAFMASGDAAHLFMKPAQAGERSFFLDDSRQSALPRLNNNTLPGQQNNNGQQTAYTYCGISYYRGIRSYLPAAGQKGELRDVYARLIEADLISAAPFTGRLYDVGDYAAWQNCPAVIHADPLYRHFRLKGSAGLFKDRNAER